MNHYGAWVLYLKEVKRFLKVYNQTLFAPMVTALLFLAVFSLALGNRVSQIGEVSFMTFLIPGLIMMTMIQNAFANSSSSLTMGKVLGSITDILLPPLSASNIAIAMTMAAITRGILTGVMVLIAVAIFHWESLGLHDAGLLVFYAFFACSTMALLGMIAGILSESFDQMSAITSYIVTPLSFLSGTFYSAKNLPEFWQIVNHGNPFFYMVDGFRYSMTGHHDGNLTLGITILIITNIALYAATHVMIARGYRLKT